MDRIPTLEEIKILKANTQAIMVFVLVEMWSVLLLWCGGTCHFMADKVLGLALSDRDAKNTVLFKPRLCIYFYRRNLCRQGFRF
jgi:hypothetical protein